MALKLVRDSPLICKSFRVQLNLELRRSFALGFLKCPGIVTFTDMITTSATGTLPYFVLEPDTVSFRLKTND